MGGETRPFGELLAEPTRNGLTRPKAVRGAGVKMVNMGELFAHPRLDNSPMDRVPLTDSEAQRFLLRTGDLLFARQSLVLEGAGKCSIFLGDDEPVTFESHVTRVRLDAQKADPRFYFYYLQSHHGRAAIASIVEQGAGASGIRGSDLGKLIVLWRQVPEQRAIAHILGTLDDKIELNRRMNETLEAMARALFKSWFVDFDPVRAKMGAAPHPKSLSRGERDFLPSPPGRQAGFLPSPPGRGAGGEGTQPAIRANAPIPTQFLDFARQLRRQATDAESLLWRLLRGRQIANAKFRRQYSFPPYILDFYCHELKLAVELDGGQHNEEVGRRRDARRDEYLAGHGIRVLRFWNNDVLRETEAVLEAIYAAVVEHSGGVPSPPAPLPGGEGNCGLPKPLADLFPDSFEDSELGEIPRGWKMVPLPQLIEVNPTRPLRKGEVAPYLDMANMPTRGHSPDVVFDRPFGSGMRFINGDTLVARITPCLENGKTAYVDFLEDGRVGWGSTEFIILRPKPPLPSEFAYCLARSEGFRDFAIQSMTGSSGRQRVPAESLSHYLLATAPPQIAERFGVIVRPLFARASAAAKESRTLAALRDTLLPKLISGELRVKDAERALTDAPV